MRILFHATGVMLFICLFLLGKITVQGREKLAQALWRVPVSSDHLCKFFLYTGKTFEFLGTVCGFLEAVAVLILVSGTAIDLIISATL